MKLTTSQIELAAALSACQGVADKKATNPMLSHVKIDADGTVCATDLYLSTKQSLNSSECVKPGSVAVPARELLERVRVMPKGELTIETNDASELSIKAKGVKRRFRLSGLPGEEFPALPEYSGDWQQVSRESLHAAINAAKHAVSDDDSRIHLHSMLLDASDDNRLVVAATDGHRLSVETVIDVPWKDSLLVPLKGVLEILRLLSDKQDDSDTVDVGNDGASLYLRTKDKELSVKLSDASFPPYSQVLPKNWKGEHKVNRLALIDAVKAVSVSASISTGGVSVSIGGGELNLQSNSPDSGEGSDSLPCESDGPNIKFGVNARYFLDSLQSLDGATVSLCVSGEFDPILIHDGGARQRVAMPMRI